MRAESPGPYQDGRSFFVQKKDLGRPGKKEERKSIIKEYNRRKDTREKRCRSKRPAGEEEKKKPEKRRAGDAKAQARREGRQE